MSSGRPEQQKKTLKITVVGDGTVGKTCLLIAYTSNTFPEEYVPTVFDNYSGEHTVQGRSYSMTLWDTAGQEEYERLRPLSYPQTHAFILCFSLNNKVSLDNVSTKWVPELRNHCPKTPIVLVGTKMDVRIPDMKTRKGENVRRKQGLNSYVECSAKTGDGIQEVFNQTILAAEGLANPKPCVLI